MNIPQKIADFSGMTGWGRNDPSTIVIPDEALSPYVIPA
jgi:hypothetical protein